MLQPSGTELEIRIGDLLVSFNDVGKKENRPVIFIHGFPFDKRMWDPQLEALGGEYRCIAYDLAGFGKTTPREEYAIETFADDLDAFMHLMQIENAAICGLSMGGYIALRAIIKYPKRFSHLILCDTQCIADTDEGKEKRFSTIRQIDSEGLAPWVKGFIKNIFTAQTLESETKYAKQIMETMLEANPAAITGTLRALAERQETCSMLNHITVPTLIICGSEDKITPPERSEFLRKNISGSRLKILSNASHLSNLERADEFNAELRNFLSAGLEVRN